MNNTLRKCVDSNDLRRLARRQDLPGVRQLFLHIALVAATSVLLAMSTGFLASVACTILLGIVLVFLFAPCHETTHKTAYDNQSLNTLVGTVCGFIIFLPFRYFQAFHMAHHRYTQNPEKDPELASPKPRSWTAYLYYLSGSGYWKEQVLSLYQCAFTGSRPDFIAEAKFASIQREARWHLGIYGAIFVISIATRSTWALEYWLLPLLLGQPFLRAFLLAEHMLCPEVPDMGRNTRTTLTNRLVRLLCWNMNYHVEHHAFPALPFFSLEKMHPMIADEIAHLASGYVEVHRRIQATLVRS